MHESLKEYFPAQDAKQDIWQALGLPSRGPRLHQLIHEGLPYDFFDRLSEMLSLDKRSLAKHAQIAPATLSRRAKSGSFTADESDRLFAFAEVLNAAQGLFEGDLEAARKWIVKPVLGLSGKSPVSMLSTRVETNAVIALIGQLEHGVLP